MHNSLFKPTMMQLLFYSNVYVHNYVDMLLLSKGQVLGCDRALEPIPFRRTHIQFGNIYFCPEAPLLIACPKKC
mgnify:CR=1 FL=1